MTCSPTQTEGGRPSMPPSPVLVPLPERSVSQVCSHCSGRWDLGTGGWGCTQPCPFREEPGLSPTVLSPPLRRGLPSHSCPQVGILEKRQALTYGRLSPSRRSSQEVHSDRGCVGPGMGLGRAGRRPSGHWVAVSTGRTLHSRAQGLQQDMPPGRRQDQPRTLAARVCAESGPGLHAGVCVPACPQRGAHSPGSLCTWTQV